MAHAAGPADHQRFAPLAMLRLDPLVVLLLAQRVVDQGLHDVPRHAGGNPPGLGPRHAALDDFALTLVVAQWRPRLLLEFADLRHQRLPLRDQVDDAGVDIVQPRAQRFEAFGYDGLVGGHRRSYPHNL